MAKNKTGFKLANPDKEPGLRDMPLPGPNDLRPGMRDISMKYGPGRSVLDFADGNDRVHNFGAPDGWPAQSPASALYTPGLRKSPKEAESDPAPMTLQPGVPRNR